MPIGKLFKGDLFPRLTSVGQRVPPEVACLSHCNPKTHPEYDGGMWMLLTADRDSLFHDNVETSIRLVQQP